MSKCDKCIHKPICEWVEENCKDFEMPAEDGKCEMFHPTEEKTVCEFAEAKNTAFDHTIEMMRSPDYKERFKAEYLQTKIRYEKLKRFNVRIKAAELPQSVLNKPIEIPKHDCPAHILSRQESAMEDYLDVLELRSVIEGIDLHE